MGVSSGFAAEMVGDLGTSASFSSLDALSSLLARGSDGLEMDAESVEATSRTSFIPAKTLTRPVIASTLDDSWTWLSCRLLMEFRISCIKAVWSGGGEDILEGRFGI